MKDLVPIDFGLPEGKLSPERLRARIEELEKQMLSSVGAKGQDFFQTRHYFADGLYAREITIPKGFVVTGKIHKFEHLNFVVSGDISVLTEDGMRRVQGPMTLISRPGTKRVGYTHDVTVWTTVHATKEKDPEQAEAALVCVTHDEYEKFLLGEDKKCLT